MIVEGKDDSSINMDVLSKELSKIKIKDSKTSINKEKGIPHFWMHAISNCYQFKILVNEKDRHVLEYLRDIRVDYMENCVINNVKIEFHVILLF